MELQQVKQQVNTGRCMSSSSSSSSVSDSEVTKFSEFSRTWWDPRQNPLIGMNSVRVGYIVNQMKQIRGRQEQRTIPPLHGLKALDVGCGGGLLSESLARLGADVTAVDPSIELVEEATKHAQMDPKTRSIDYRGGCTVEQLAEEMQSSSSSATSPEGNLFDVICLLEVIEHVVDVPTVLSSARALLKPESGRLFVSTMNRTMKSNVVAIVGAEYIMGYLPPGTHDWNQFRSPREVRELMRRAGLEEIDVQGMVLTKPPLFGQWHWTLDPTDTDINWIGTYQVKS
jgi:ubiquinone biosynthesis O-methyltransferase